MMPALNTTKVFTLLYHIRMNNYIILSSSRARFCALRSHPLMLRQDLDVIDFNGVRELQKVND